MRYFAVNRKIVAFFIIIFSCDIEGFDIEKLKLIFDQFKLQKSVRQSEIFPRNIPFSRQVSFFSLWCLVFS